MESSINDPVLMITTKENITPPRRKYINSCKQVSEIKNHYFNEGDFFFHADFGINKVERGQSNGEFYSHVDLSIPIPAKDSIWLPTVDQIKELFCSHALEHLIDNFDYFVEKERLTSLSLEEQWLIYYKSILLSSNKAGGLGDPGPGE